MGKWQISESSKKYLQVIIVAFSVYLGMKYLSPIASPFILAFLLVGLINPLVNGMQKKLKIGKSVLAGAVLLFFLLTAVIVCWILGMVLVTGGRHLAEGLPGFREEIMVFIQSSLNNIEERLGVDALVIENFISEQIEVFADNLEVNVFPAVMGKSVNILKLLGGVFGFLAVTGIATLLIIKDYDKVMNRLLEEESFHGILEVCVKVVIYIKTFVKAQAVILCVISGICAVVLGIAGIRGGIIYGILAGFMDMLPFIGTGIMLMPLAFFLLLQERYWQAVICVGLYGVCALVREFLEPKLIGNKIGVWPVGILLAVFAGIKLFGVSGIMKGPLALVIVCEVCKYLWKKDI